MTMKYFGGKPYDAPMYENIEEVPMEEVIGKECIFCQKKIVEGNVGIVFANGPVAHLTGFLRSTLGSVAHIEKRCSCFGGRDEHVDQADWCQEGVEVLARVMAGTYV